MDLQDIEKNLLGKIQDTLMALEEEWFQMSLPQNQVTHRKELVYNCFSDVCNKIVSDEKMWRERILKRIEDGKLEIFRLCQELDTSFDEPSNLGVLEYDKYITQKIMNLKEQKDTRVAEFKDLAATDECLCSYLGEEPCHISEHLIPSTQDLETLRTHIEDMQEEKTRRQSEYKSLRHDIVGFMEVTEKELESELVLDLVCNSDSDGSLTRQYLLDIRKLHSELDFEVKEFESTSLELREKIESLWGLLRILTQEKDAFLTTVPSHSPSSIKKLETYLVKLKDIRAQNLDAFAEEMRIELETWWARCHVGADQKGAVRPTEKVTEETLDRYEKELNKWKHYYKTNVSILEKVDYFLALFDNMQQLEERAKDPSRLFNTRGGALLQEEKERKRVKSELPVVQDQLINLCSEYEACNGVPFLIDGSSIEEYLCKLWDYHDMQREKDKTDRLQNKQRPLATHLRVKSSTKKTPSSSGVGVGTPSSLFSSAAGVCSRKRVREGDDMGGKSKRATPVSSGSLAKSPFKIQRPAMIGACSSSAPRPMALTNHNVMLAPLPPFPQSERKGTDKHETQNNSISYDNFKEMLRGRNENFFNSTSLSVAEEIGQENPELTF